MSFVLRPATRENTPLTIGLSGPTKSGKTFSALRLAIGMAEGRGPIVMINSEGKAGHQYADKFKYQAVDIRSPYSYERYTEALDVAAGAKPGALIIDSISHAHDGPGGMLEQHEAELDRMAGNDWKKRERATWTAWIRPKALENRFIYRLEELEIPTVLCFRAKEKIRIVKGQDPIDLGWQPISSDRIAFQTIFTLVIPPEPLIAKKGIPDLTVSDLRQPFDTMIATGKQIDEDLGRRLALWAAGGSSRPAPETQDKAPLPKTSPEPTSEAEAVQKALADTKRLALRAKIQWGEVMAYAQREMGIHHDDEFSTEQLRQLYVAVQKDKIRPDPNQGLPEDLGGEFDPGQGTEGR